MADLDRYKREMKLLQLRAVGKSTTETQVMFLEAIVKLQIEFLENFGNIMNKQQAHMGDYFTDEAKGVKEILTLLMNPPK